MSYCLYRVILEERPSVRVLANAVDDSSSTALARTRTLYILITLFTQSLRRYDGTAPVQ